VDLFEPDDLIEGYNKLKVIRTLQVLRKMVDKNYDEKVSNGHATVVVC